LLHSVCTVPSFTNEIYTTLQFHGRNWWFTFIIAFTCIKDFPCLLNSKYVVYMFRLSTYKLMTYISLLLFSLLILRWTLPLNFSSFHSLPFGSYLLQILLLLLFTLMKVWYLFPPRLPKNKVRSFVGYFFTSFFSYKDSC